eukprot:GEMP01000241.1.p1 GENE.GEMP01000241.1~~GEMP01000241.1.p1  ORF type:complete len:2334 (-),score=254.91 GEMP01000241.1:650-7651(-)
MFVFYLLISGATSSWASSANRFTDEAEEPQVFLRTPENNMVANGAGDMTALTMRERHEAKKANKMESPISHHNAQESNSGTFLVVGFGSGHSDFSSTCISFANNLSTVTSARVARNLKLCVLKVTANFTEKSEIQETVGVKFIEDSVKFRPMELQGQYPTDVMWNIQIGFRDMDFPNAWSVHAGSISKKQTVAVLDSGLDKEHPDFWHHGLDGSVSIYSADSKNFIDDTDPIDETGHGTGVAGMIAADTTLKDWTFASGIPPGFATGAVWSGVEIMALKFIDHNSVGESAHLVLALDFLIGKADVRLSAHAYGAYYYSASHTHIAHAFSALSNNDHLAIAAAGNDGRLLAGNNLMYPCCLGLANGGPLCVANFNVTRNALHATSNRGAGCAHVAAPGFALTPAKISDSSFSQYSASDSTSNAAAFTTGVAVLVNSLHMDRGETVAADQIRTKLEQTVKPYALEVSTGGVIDAYKAVFGSLSQCPSTRCPSPNFPWMCSDSSCKNDAYMCRQLGLYVLAFCPPAGISSCRSWATHPGNCPSGFTPDPIKANLTCGADFPCTKQNCCKGCAPHEGAQDEMLCFDGTTCTTTYDSKCCEDRARCPYNVPYMCKTPSSYSVQKQYGGIPRSGDDARCQIDPYDCEPDGLIDHCPTLCASLDDDDKTGYIVTEHSSDTLDFSVDVACDTSNGYIQVGSGPQARPCSQPNGKYLLSGCKLATTTTTKAPMPVVTTATLTTTLDLSGKRSCCPTEVTCKLHDCGQYSGSTLKPNPASIVCPNATCTNTLCCDGFKLGTGGCVSVNGASPAVWKRKIESSPETCANFCKDYPLSCVGFSWEPRASGGLCLLYKDRPLAVAARDSSNHDDTNMVESCFVRKAAFAAEWPVAVNPSNSVFFYLGCLVKGDPDNLRDLFPSNGISSTRACAVHCASFDLFALHETDCLCFNWEELNGMLKLFGEYGDNSSCAPICRGEGNLIPARYCGKKRAHDHDSAVALYEVLAIENGADCPDNGHKVKSDYVYLRGAMSDGVTPLLHLQVRSCQLCAKACTNSNQGTNACNGYICVPNVSNAVNTDNVDCTLVGNPIPSLVSTGAQHICARRSVDDVEVVACTDKYDRQSGFVMLVAEAGLRQTFTDIDNCDDCATSCTAKEWCVAYQCSTLLRLCALFNNETLLNDDSEWLSSLDLIDISLCLKLPNKKCIVQDGTMLHEQNCLCGNDGSTMCRGHHESCSVRKPELLAGQGRCGDLTPAIVVGDCLRVRECEKCSNLGCSDVIAHVCATNGRTYGNRCYATCAGQQVAHIGSCDDISPPIHSSHCKETTVDTDVVCGSDKNTYLSPCFLDATPGIHAVTRRGEICPEECASVDLGQRDLCSLPLTCACWSTNGAYKTCERDTYCTSAGTCVPVCSSLCADECLCETGPNVHAYCGRHEHCAKKNGHVHSSCIPECSEYPTATTTGNSQCLCGSFTKCGGSNVTDSEPSSQPAVCQQSRCVQQTKPAGSSDHLTCLPVCDAFSGSGDGSWKADCICQTNNQMVCTNNTYCNATAETCVPGCTNRDGQHENKDSCICGPDLQCKENNYCYKKNTTNECLYEPIKTCSFRNGQAPNERNCFCGTAICDKNEFCTTDAQHGNECTAGPITKCSNSTLCVSHLCKCDSTFCPPGSVCSPANRRERECIYVLPRCSEKWERKCLCGTHGARTVCDVAPDGSRDWACTKPGVHGFCAKPPARKCPDGYHIGTSYDFVITPTLQACAYTCTAEPLCSHFVYNDLDKCERFYDFGLSNPDGYYDANNVAILPLMLCEKNCATPGHDCASPAHPICDMFNQKCRKCTPTDCDPGQFCTTEGRCVNAAEVPTLCNSMADARTRSKLSGTRLDNLGKRTCLQEFNTDYCDIFFWNMQRVGESEDGGSCEFWCNKDGLFCAQAWRDSQNFVSRPFDIGCPKGPESSCDSLPTNSICRCSRVPSGGDCGGSPNLICSDGGCLLKNGNMKCTTSDARKDCACRGTCGDGKATAPCTCGETVMNICAIGETCNSTSGTCTAPTCAIPVNITALVDNALSSTCGTTLQAGASCVITCASVYAAAGSGILECGTSMGRISKVPACTPLGVQAEAVTYVASKLFLTGDIDSTTLQSKAFKDLMAKSLASSLSVDAANVEIITVMLGTPGRLFMVRRLMAAFVQVDFRVKAANIATQSQLTTAMNTVNNANFTQNMATQIANKSAEMHIALNVSSIDAEPAIVTTVYQPISTVAPTEATTSTAPSVPSSTTPPTPAATNTTPSVSSSTAQVTPAAISATRMPPAERRRLRLLREALRGSYSVGQPQVTQEPHISRVNARGKKNGAETMK